MDMYGIHILRTHRVEFSFERVLSSWQKLYTMDERVIAASDAMLVVVWSSVYIIIPNRTTYILHHFVSAFRISNQNLAHHSESS